VIVLYKLMVQTKMNLLCHVIGHKHKHTIGDYSEYVREKCIRCDSPSPLTIDEGGQRYVVEHAGDDVLRCKLIGHKHKIFIGDSVFPNKQFCLACHFSFNQVAE